ncbi:MAG: GNAT family N-acetyltransferase [Bacteroidia bacterium]
MIKALTFDNFTIRPVSIHDGENYFLFVDNNRDRIIHFLPVTVNSNKTIDETKIYLEDRILKASQNEVFTLVICDNATDKIIGLIFIKNIEWNIPKCEFGYCIDKNYEGKGIMTKGLSLVIDECFQSMKMNKIFMRIHESNISSRRIAEKNGFIVEGILRSDFKSVEGKLLDIMYFGLLRPD